MSRSKTKLKLPKRIAGVKLPKSVRRGELGAFIASPAGSALIAEALLMLGAAFAGHEAVPGSKTRKLAKKSKAAVKDLGEDAAPTLQAAPQAAADASARVVQAFHEAASTFRRVLNDPDDAPAALAPAVRAAAKKKPATPAAAALKH